MIAVAVSNSVLAGAISSLFVIVAALGVAIARLHGRITRLEEWVRVNEQRRGKR